MKFHKRSSRHLAKYYSLFHSAVLLNLGSFNVFPEVFSTVKIFDTKNLLTGIFMRVVYVFMEIFTYS